MATDMQKMLRLVTEQTGVGRIEDPDAESVMQDESGREYLRLEMRVHRDIVKEARYVADGEVNVNVAAAMAAVTQIAQGKAIMVATLIKPADIEKELSDGSGLDEEDRPAVAAAAVMLHECLRNYSMRYNARRKERLEKLGISPDAPEGEEA